MGTLASVRCSLSVLEVRYKNINYGYTELVRYSTYLPLYLSLIYKFKKRSVAKINIEVHRQ